MKNPMTPAGIEPATFQFVAQHLNQCATAVPHKLQLSDENGNRHIKQNILAISTITSDYPSTVNF